MVELGLGEVCFVTLDTNVIGVVEAVAKDMADGAAAPVMTTGTTES